MLKVYHILRVKGDDVCYTILTVHPNTKGGHPMCHHLLQQLLAALQPGFRVEPLDGENKSCLVLTPFLHFDMSYIELFVDRTADGYRITDAGETLNMLFVSGVAVEEQPTLMQQAQLIAQMHEVSFSESELSAEAGEETLGDVAARLVHAIQAVGFLVYYRDISLSPALAPLSPARSSCRG